MGTGHLRCVRSAQGKVSNGGMESNGAPLMAPSRCGRCGFNEGVWKAQVYCALGVSFQVVGDRVLELQFQSVGNKEMAGCSSLTREGSKEGFHYSRCVGGQRMGSMGKEVAENQGMGSKDENLGERRYKLENLAMERRSMSRLERDIDTSLRFEQGGRQSTNPLWLMRILLGCLFRERLVLGQAIKMFANF